MMFTIYGYLSPANNYLFTTETVGKKSEIWSQLTMKTPERRQWRLSGVFTVNFEHIFAPFSSVSIDDFEQVNINWVYLSW